METLNFGIRKDLQADVRHEPNACKGHVMDISLGCAHHCIYCIFSPLEKKVYRLFNSQYNNQVIPLKLDRFLERTEFPSEVYLCYSSDPLAGPEMIASTKTVLKKLFAHNVSVFFITKGIFTDDILEIIAVRPDLMAIQVGITNVDHRRNRIIEPGAPGYEQRIENFRKLSSITGFKELSVRIDPMFPGIDDTVENISRILDDTRAFGVTDAVLGYVILNETLRDILKQNPFLRSSVEAVSEKTPTISNRTLFSLPLEEKISRLNSFQELCRKKNVTMSVCGCKDERLKNHDFPWICHPFKKINEPFDIRE